MVLLSPKKCVFTDFTCMWATKILSFCKPGTFISSSTLSSARSSFSTMSVNGEAQKRPVDVTEDDANALAKKTKILNDPDSSCVLVQSSLSPQKEEEPAKTSDSQPLNSNVNSDAAKRIKKKKVAMLLGYCGQGYLGMQRNPGFKTIEEELFQAFRQVGIMDDESFTVPQSIQFQRAARTDKGVSAVRQIVSLKMGPTTETTVKDLCATLPDCIRVFAVKRATQGFNSKHSCDSRTYSYLLPSFAFASAPEMTNPAYRIDPDTLQRVRDTLSLFKGTKNFHNFTSRRKAEDASAKRYIMSFTSSDPFVVDDMEYLKLCVRGQSFMLHQIRKMVGMAIALVRGVANLSNLEKAWQNQRIDIPIAPSLGLFLEQPHYDSYNRRYGNDGMHEALEWSSVETEVEAFGKKYIHETIYKVEREEKSMENWLVNLPLHTYDVREHDPRSAPGGDSETEEQD